MRRKISWTDGQMERGKTVYPPPPSGSGGIQIQKKCRYGNEWEKQTLTQLLEETTPAKWLTTICTGQLYC